MTGRWIKKVAKFADSIVDRVKESASEKIDNIEEKVNRWSDIGKQCRQISHETVQICQETQIQRQAMIDFASDIKSTLEAGFGNDDDIVEDDRGLGENGAAILSTIKDLTDGHKVREAMNIATGLNDITTKFIEKSNDLSDLMDQGIEELPRFMKTAITNKSRDINETRDDQDGADESVTFDDNDAAELIHGIESDVQDVQTCIDEIRHFNLATALKVGMKAFVQLADKANRSQALFTKIEKYANEVYVVTHSFKRETMLSTKAFSTVKNVTKSMMSVIRSTSLIRVVSEGAKNLLKAIVHLFEVISNEVSKLWSSLAFAKDCMMKCIQHVLDAKQLCAKAKNTALELIGKSSIVARKLQSASELDFGAIRSLALDGEIQDTMDLATNIDNEVLECTTQVVNMIQVVTNGFQKLPEMITSEIDMKEAGTRDHEDDDEFFRSIPTVDDDVLDFESRSRSLDDDDVLSASNASVRGFSDISENTVGKCIRMVETLEAFAEKCNETITSFMSVWNLNSAAKKIDEMCRIINIGELMKQIAGRIQRLASAMKQYMKAVINKFTKFPNGKFLKQSQEHIKNAISTIQEGCSMFRC